MMTAERAIDFARTDSNAVSWATLIAFFCCGVQGTGVVLLADILPSFTVKLVAPYFIHHVTYGSLQLVASSSHLTTRLFGVVLASLSSGLGELSFLMLTSFFHPAVVGAWSSGTGGAGVSGSVAFLALTTWAGFSTPTALRMVSVLPPFMMLFYAWYLRSAVTAQHQSRAVQWLKAAVLDSNSLLRRLGLVRFARGPSQRYDRYQRLDGHDSLEDSADMPSTRVVEPPHTTAAYAALPGESVDVTLHALQSPTLSLRSLSLELNCNRGSYQPLEDGDEGKQQLHARFARIPKIAIHDMTLAQRFAVVRPLLSVYIMPLLVVYWVEYTINQGISPTLLFPIPSPRPPLYPITQLKDHYVYYQALYQVGVFISRSSVHWFPIRRLWYPSLLQVGVLGLVLTQALWMWIPSVWLVFSVVLFEGLLGATYVNTFYNIRNDVPLLYREFALGVTGVGDSIGITLAGLTALWLEPSLCRWQQANGIDLCTLV
ncbi:battenin CLN3 protein [Dimargaris xerosporica]|nr:battenin CLN3 protein [Dimargaris xerosporica]